MGKEFFNPDYIRQAIDILKPNGQLFEVRIIRGPKILSGYFRGHETLIRELAKQDLNRCNVYITLHEIHSGCAARIQYEQFLEVGREKIPATSASDILNYQWIPIDVDPVRPAGISSNKDELEAAAAMAKDVRILMREWGYTDYVLAFSGNGYHLLFRTNIKNDDEGKETVKNCLAALDDMLSNDACHIDTTSVDPSRVFKLYGTLAQKGRDTQDRPHRMSKILMVGDENEED